MFHDRGWTGPQLDPQTCVHSLTFEQKATALPNGERSATRILRERAAYRFAVDRDEQSIAAYGLHRKE
jgi:hypothetical protein